MNFAGVQSVTIPEGDVRSIAIGGVTVWTKPNPIPYDAEVEYVESTGTQYVDTDIIPQNGDSLSIRFQCLSRGSKGGGLFSAGNGSYQFIALFAGTPSNVVYCKYFATGSAASLTFSGTAWATLTVSGTGEFRIGQNTATSAYQSPIDGTPNNLRMFARANGDQKFNGRISSAEYYRNGVLVRSFVPVRVGTVGYLYDRANPTGGPLGNGLYGSATSTPLVAGPDINGV